MRKITEQMMSALNIIRVVVLILATLHLVAMYLLDRTYFISAAFTLLIVSLFLPMIIKKVRKSVITAIRTITIVLIMLGPGVILHEVIINDIMEKELINSLEDLTLLDEFNEKEVEDRETFLAAVAKLSNSSFVEISDNTYYKKSIETLGNRYVDLRDVPNVMLASEIIAEIQNRELIYDFKAYKLEMIAILVAIIISMLIGFRFNKKPDFNAEVIATNMTYDNQIQMNQATAAEAKQIATRGVTEMEQAFGIFYDGQEEFDAEHDRRLDDLVIRINGKTAQLREDKAKAMTEVLARKKARERARISKIFKFTIFASLLLLGYMLGIIWLFPGLEVVYQVSVILGLLSFGISEIMRFPMGNTKDSIIREYFLSILDPIKVYLKKRKLIAEERRTPHKTMHKDSGDTYEILDKDGNTIHRSSGYNLDIEDIEPLVEEDGKIQDISHEEVVPKMPPWFPTLRRVFFRLIPLPLLVFILLNFALTDNVVLTSIFGNEYKIEVSNLLQNPNQTDTLFLNNYQNTHIPNLSDKGISGKVVLSVQEDGNIYAKFIGIKADFENDCSHCSSTVTLKDMAIQLPLLNTEKVATIDFEKGLADQINSQQVVKTICPKHKDQPKEPKTVEIEELPTNEELKLNEISKKDEFINNRSY